jgi:hypothetical protein
MPQLIDRFNTRLRDEQQALLDAGSVEQLEDLRLLEGKHLRPVALLSLLLLILGALLFGALNIASYFWHTRATSGSIGGWTLILWIVINMLAYIVILPIHELIHGLAFSFWGGRPHYGMKLPIALYCGARNQIFRRSHYLVVGLAPFVIITLVGLLVTLLFPAFAAYTFLAWVGNFSGAAGDLYSAVKLLRYPADALIEDTETGFRIWRLGVPASAGERRMDVATPKLLS